MQICTSRPQACVSLTLIRYCARQAVPISEKTCPRVLASSDYAIVEEHLLLHNHLMSRVEGRLEVLNGPNGYPNDIKGE